MKQTLNHPLGLQGVNKQKPGSAITELTDQKNQVDESQPETKIENPKKFVKSNNTENE